MTLRYKLLYGHRPVLGGLSIWKTSNSMVFTIHILLHWLENKKEKNWHSVLPFCSSYFM